ncbi:MAG: TetR/AcrR family transcriptional regulator [Clostridiales bacterium]|nr:TetR/AcrR family transcriptional regulator [Clostridiales bacterium]
MKKEDLRITKTKRDLRLALIYLLKDVPFEKVTIGDICEKAMVNRMTFYKHFKDKYDLLDHAIDSLLGQIIQKVAQQIMPVDSFDDFVEFCVLLAKTIIEESSAKKDIFPELYRSDSGIVYDVLTRTMHHYISLLVQEVGKYKKLKHSLQTTTEFLSGGIIHLICYWLLHIDEFDKNDFIKGSEIFTRELITSNLFFTD